MPANLRAFPQDAFASQYSARRQRILQMRFGVEAAWKGVQPGRDAANACRAALFFMTRMAARWENLLISAHGQAPETGKSYERDFQVPPDARRIQVTLGLNGCEGTAWFADAHLR